MIRVISELPCPEAIVILDVLADEARIYTGAWRPIRVSLEHANEEIVALSETFHITYHDLYHNETSIPVALLPYGWDQVEDGPDHTWCEPYDTDSPRIIRGEAEITEAEAADLNAWMSSLPPYSYDYED